MKKFFAFYNSSFDLQSQAQTYADEATVHATSRGKTIASQVVDVLSQSGAKKHWNGQNTIECVTVDDDDTKKDSMLNPSALTDIDGMIDRL